MNHGSTFIHSISTAHPVVKGDNETSNIHRSCSFIFRPTKTSMDSSETIKCSYLWDFMRDIAQIWWPFRIAPKNRVIWSPWPTGCPMLHRFFKRQDTRPARSHPKRWSSARSWRMQWVWRPVDQGAENQLGGKWHVKMYQCVRAHNHHACGYHNFCMFRRLCFRRD